MLEHSQASGTAAWSAVQAARGQAAAAVAIVAACVQYPVVAGRTSIGVSVAVATATVADYTAYVWFVANVAVGGSATETNIGADNWFI